MCRRVPQGYKPAILFSYSKRELISHFTWLLCSLPTYLWTMCLPDRKRNKTHSYLNSVLLSWHHVKLNLSSGVFLHFPNQVPDCYRLQADQRPSRGEE